MPALLLAGAKTLFRIQGVVGDDVVVFALATLQLAAGTWLVARAARTFFGDPPVALQVLAILVMGLANPTPYNLARPAVYEAAIVGAHAFLLLGMAFAFEAVARARAAQVAGGCRRGLGVRRGVPGQRRARRRAAGLADRVARAGRRPGQGAAAVEAGGGCLSLPSGFRWRSGRSRCWRTTDCGSTAGSSSGGASSSAGSPRPPGRRFIAPNVYSYLLRAPALSCRFPYVFALAEHGRPGFPVLVPAAPGYFIYEQVVGLLLAVPCSWTAPVGWIAALRDWRRQRRMTDRAWAVWMATIAGTAPIAAPLLIASATNRYLGDVVGGVALSGAFGVWILYAGCAGSRPTAAPSWPGRRTLAGLSVAAGLALGFYGQYGQFPANNPTLTEQLVRRLSVCGPVVPPPPN